MLMSLLGLIATALTCTMFASKQMMLGFPAMIFWFLLGGYAYSESTAAWDLYFMLAFSCFLGMGFLTGFGMYALRTKKEEVREGDAFVDEVPDDSVYVDEEKGNKESEPEESRLSNYAGNVRKRRNSGNKKPRWGEFS